MRYICTKCLVLLMILAIPTGLPAQGKSSKNTSSAKHPSEEVEVERYCYGPQYNADKEHFRACAWGESIDEMVSKKNAMTKARMILAYQIVTLVQEATDNYMASYYGGNKMGEMLGRYDTLTGEMVKQQLDNAIEICNKQMKTEKGRYQTYITIELAGSAVFSSLNSRIAGDQVLRVDYNYEKFKEIFEKKMVDLALQESH